MRPLTEKETQAVFEKLAKYIGRNITNLIDRSDDPYVFRLQKNRVYYIKEKIMKYAESVGRDHLLSAGICFGKFTKTKKFILHITCLDYLAQYAKFKIWIKASSEMSYMYGNHILKAHVSKMSDDIPQHQGVLVCSSNDVPLGFALTARSTLETRLLDPTAIVAFHQADVGEYLREEDTLF